MAIIRVQKKENYTVMSNHHFKNRNLSLKAKGLLSLMLSLPDDWDYTVDGLVTMGIDGKDSVRSALRELESENYLVRSREKDDKGRLGGAIYDVYENPMLEKPTAENPTQENPPLLNTNTSNTKELNTKTLSKGVKPTIEEIQTYIDEQHYCVDAEQFFDFYESKGWLVGKSKMKDWKAAVRTWNSRNKKEVKGKDAYKNQSYGKTDSGAKSLPKGWAKMFSDGE